MPRGTQALGTWWSSGEGSKNHTKAEAVKAGARCLVQLNDCDKGYRRFGCFQTWEACREAVATIPPRHRHLFEVVPHGRPCKPYLDLDGAALPPGVATVDELADRVERFVTQIFETDYGFPGLAPSAFVWMHSPNQTKVSLHLVVATHAPQLVYRSNHQSDEHGAFHLAQRIKQLDPECCGLMVDASVYSRDREFRMMGASKHDKPQSVLALMRGGVDDRREGEPFTRDSVITWTDDDDVREIVVPVHIPRATVKRSSTHSRAAASGAAVRDVKVAEGGGIPEPILRRLVAALKDSRADDRSEWLGVVFATKHVSLENGYVDAGRRIAHEFSMRCRGKYDAREVDKLYDAPVSGMSVRRPLGAGSLFKWLKDDDPAALAELRAAMRASIGRVDFIRDADDDDVIADGGARDDRTPLDWDCSTVANAVARRLGTDGDVDVVDAVVVNDRLKFHIDGVEVDAFVDLGTLRFGRGDEPSGFLHGVAPGLAMGSLVLRGTDAPTTGWNTVRPSASQIVMLCDGTPRTELVMDLVNGDVERVTVRYPDRNKSFVLKANKEMLATIRRAYTDAVKSHLNTELMVPVAVTNAITINFNGCTFNSITNVAVGASTAVQGAIAGAPGATDFAVIRAKLLQRAIERGMRKRDGIVYEPVEGCPCAFVERFEFAGFINHVLKGDPVYTSDVRRFDEAMKYLKNYEDDEMPLLVTDRDLMSFGNGILQLSTGVFTPYSELAEGESRVARHHVAGCYTGCTDTPLLDTVLLSQFDADVADLLLALIGRTLFKVGQLDSWQVMPYLVGIGGTGKSLILNIVQRLFAPGAVGNLAAKREDVFGMANLVDKEVVMGRDMPAKLSGSLPQEIMQAMTAGEGMEIPRKGLTALNVTWAAPVIMASNHMPDYVNTGNNVGRRLVTFRFDHVVSAPQEGLQEAIIAAELPNILCRALKAYEALRARVKAMGGFWKAVPVVVVEWQGQLAASTNKLHAFFTMDEEERGCSIAKVDGRVTWLLDFKAAFEKKMGAGAYVADPAVFAAFGFRVSEKRENVCQACKQLAKGRGGRCCPDYSSGRRTFKAVIFDMVIASVCAN